MKIHETTVYDLLATLRVAVAQGRGGEIIYANHWNGGTDLYAGEDEDKDPITTVDNLS